MNAWMIALMVLASGTTVALQAPSNAMLSKAFGSPIVAALISFSVGTAALAAVALVTYRRVPDWGTVAGLPTYAWFGGLYGAVFVTVAAIAVPRIGVASTLILLIAGQVVMAAVLDHYGAFGVAKQALTPLRLLGLVLVGAGVVLVRKF